MWITTRATYDIATGRLLAWEGFKYHGMVDRCGSGPSEEQKTAAASQAALNAYLISSGTANQTRVNKNYDLIEPYASERLKSGLPFFGALTDYGKGTTGRAFQPARAALERRLSSFGSLPSGFAEQSRRDLDTAQAHAFDDSMRSNLLMNEQAKQDATRILTGQAQVLNPLGYFGTATSGNNSIMQAPLQKPGFAGVLGGLTGGALGAL